jgi:hypothetical protein
MTLIIHLYYAGSWEMIKKKCSYIIDIATKIIITSCYNEVIDEIEPHKKLIIFKVPNKGKDIGGKLAALYHYIKFCEKTEYLIFVHDKISPQTINAEYWSDKLFSIFEKKKFQSALLKMSQSRKIGIIGAKAFLKNEYIRSKNEFATTNNKILLQLLNEYSVTASRYNYIAGTIFISRSKIFENFFSVFSPLKAREKLEAGNVLDLTEGTYTHSWERLMCYIGESQGYLIEGL